MRSREYDCFAGDMIILSVSVFKEDVAFGSTEGTRKRECPRAKEGVCVRVYERGKA